MRIYLCANCGQIGNEASFEVSKQAELDPAMAKIVQSNGFILASAPLCPSCKSNKIFYKTVADLHTSGVESAVVPPPAVLTIPPLEVKLGAKPEVQPEPKPLVKIDTKPVATDPDIDEKLLAEALESASDPETPKPTPLTDEEKAIVREKLSRIGVRTEDTSKRRTPKCDNCGKEFSTKIPGTTRCKECLDKLIHP